MMGAQYACIQDRFVYLLNLITLRSARWRRKFWEAIPQLDYRDRRLQV